MHEEVEEGPDEDIPDVGSVARRVTPRKLKEGSEEAAIDVLRSVVKEAKQ